MKNWVETELGLFTASILYPLLEQLCSSPAHQKPQEGSRKCLLTGNSVAKSTGRKQDLIKVTKAVWRGLNQQGSKAQLMAERNVTPLNNIYC